MPQIVNIAIDQLFPHPDNPRKDLGDLTELAASIKASGVLQNLTVVPRLRDMTDEKYRTACAEYRANPTEEGQRIVNRHTVAEGYTIIIGHRRHAAAQLAGLTELPCIVVEMDAREQLQTMLVENMQRSDLTVYEQAQGFQMMLDLGDSVEQIAEKSGFSKATVRRRLKMAELDSDTLKEVSSRQLSLSDFDKLAQVESLKTRNKLLKDIGTYNFDGAVSRAIREEHRKKVLPEAKKQIKDLGLKLIPDSDRYSSKYESVKCINLDNWEPESGFRLGNSDGILYYIDNWGTLSFYRKRKRAASEKKSQAQIEEEKAIAAAHAAIKEEEEIAFDLRQKFIQNLTVTQKNIGLILRGAAIGIVAAATLYKSPDRNALIKMMGVDPDGKWDETRDRAVSAAASLTNNDLAPEIIYAQFQDSKKNGYHSSYLAEWPKHEKNLMLDALYAWLELMGYEMSDDEKGLQNGTHRLFTHSGNVDDGGERQ